ncbi:MAG: glucose/arabinose dehydrogenase [Limisphaerales bacterium]|jgi:glucose/arabinose dehydrogenase
MKNKFLHFLTVGLVAGALNAEAGLELQPVASGFVAPMVLEPVSDGSGALLIADQPGTISVLGKDGKVRKELFLDLRPRMAKLRGGFDERGLLGLALHPKFKSNRKFYVYYSAPLRQGGPARWDHTAHVSEFSAAENALKADPDSERVVLRIDQPQFNHDGGRIAFGPDGFLYIGMGDGGNKNDQDDDKIGSHGLKGNGQNINTLLGKILRIDIDTRSDDRPYGIPADNPFVGKKGLDEIYAVGLRNPWGISFDQGGDRQLFCADVGQNMFEEINIIENGGNYGWRIREGRHGFDPENPTTIPENAPTKDATGTAFKEPILEYLNIKGFQAARYAKEIRGASVTGGYVYRGSAIPQLKGQYVFGDWSQNFGLPMGKMLVANRTMATGGKEWELRALQLENLPKAGGRQLGAFIVALGQDLAGEIYVMTNASNSIKGKTGMVWKLVKK